MEEQGVASFGPICESGKPTAPWTCSVQFQYPEVLREVTGPMGSHLKVMEKVLQIRMSQGGMEIALHGEQENVQQAVQILQELISVVGEGMRLSPGEVEQMCRLLRDEPETSLVSLHKDTLFVGYRKKRIYPRSERQQNYCNAIRAEDLVFGVGPAGTGKSFLAVAMALGALHREEVRKIVLCRPAVEAGEKLGFLPGDLLEKVNPYLRPLYDALFVLVGADKGNRMIEREIIEVAPLAFMRGRTLTNSFVILDEAQNTSIQQMKMFLTRIGVGSKVVVNGDPSQVDLPRGMQSGLRHALSILKNVDGISMCHLTDADVVRHPLVSAVIRAYRQDEARK